MKKPSADRHKDTSIHVRLHNQAYNRLRDIAAAAGWPLSHVCAYILECSSQILTNPRQTQLDLISLAEILSSAAKHHQRKNDLRSLPA